jgi:hypothetical protein
VQGKGYSNDGKRATRSRETVARRGMRGKSNLTTDELMLGAIPNLPERRQTAVLATCAVSRTMRSPTQSARIRGTF